MIGIREYLKRGREKRKREREREREKERERKGEFRLLLLSRYARGESRVFRDREKPHCSVDILLFPSIARS